MAADTFYQVFEKVKYKLVLGLTGTLDRLDGKESLIKDKCPIIDQLTMEEAIDNGWLSPYKEYKVLIDVDLEDYNNANQEFLKYFAVFDFDFNLAMNCVKDYQTRYKLAQHKCTLPKGHPSYHNTVKEINKEVTASAFSWNRALKARKDFVMNHPKKIEVTRKILESRADKKCITFSATIKAAEEIGIGYVLHSGKTKKKRGIIKEEFDKLTTGVLNTSKALDCGADIPGLNVGVILCNTSSSIQKRQRLGRVIRFAPNKKAELFSLVLRGTMEEQWFKKSTGKMEYETINENQLDNILNGTEVTARKRDESGFDFKL